MNSSTYLFLWKILEERLPLLDRTHDAVAVDHLVKESLPLYLGLPLESSKFRRLETLDQPNIPFGSLEM
jgi:hypothetical protein